MKSQYVSDKIRSELQKRLELTQKIINPDFVEQIKKATIILNRVLQKNNKIMIFGNGGSATQSMHLAAELVGKFNKVRKALPAIALTSDVASLTSISNDIGYQSVFSRQIEALGQRGDAVIGISTSDASTYHSANILNAFKVAKKLHLIRLGLFSKKTKHLLKYVDEFIIVPDTETAIIQEVHLEIAHIICGLLEGDLKNSE